MDRTEFCYKLDYFFFHFHHQARSHDADHMTCGNLIGWASYHGNKELAGWWSRLTQEYYWQSANYMMKIILFLYLLYVIYSSLVLKPNLDILYLCDFHDMFMWHVVFKKITIPQSMTQNCSCYFHVTCSLQKIAFLNPWLEIVHAIFMWHVVYKN